VPFQSSYRENAVQGISCVNTSTIAVCPIHHRLAAGGIPSRRDLPLPLPFLFFCIPLRGICFAGARAPYLVRTWPKVGQILCASTSMSQFPNMLRSQANGTSGPNEGTFMTANLAPSTAKSNTPTAPNTRHAFSSPVGRRSPVRLCAKADATASNINNRRGQVSTGPPQFTTNQAAMSQMRSSAQRFGDCRRSTVFQRKGSNSVATIFGSPQQGNRNRFQ